MPARPRYGDDPYARPGEYDNPSRQYEARDSWSVFDYERSQVPRRVYDYADVRNERSELNAASRYEPERVVDYEKRRLPQSDHSSQSRDYESPDQVVNSYYYHCCCYHLFISDYLTWQYGLSLINT